MERSRCGNCGAMTPAVAAFCSRCGSVVSGGVPPTTDERGWEVERGVPLAAAAPIPVIPVATVATVPRSQVQAGAIAFLLVLVAIGGIWIMLAVVWPSRVKPYASPGPAPMTSLNGRPQALTGRPNVPEIRTIEAPPVRVKRTAAPVPRRGAMAEFEPPTLPGGRVAIPLGEAFREYHVGGGGRYHLFHLRKAGTIAVVDVSAAAVTRTIPVGPDEVRFAAGLNYFVVLNPAQRTLQRWSLKTFAREGVARLPGDRPLREMAMAPGDDVLYLTFDDVTLTYDVKSMQVVKQTGAVPEVGPTLAGMRLSFDGQTAAVGPHNLVLSYGRRVKVGTTERPDADGTGYQPSADGTLVFAGRRMFTREGRKVDVQLGDGACVPSVDPRYFWFVSADGPAAQASLYTTADRRRVHALRGLEESVVSPGGPTPKFWHLPQAKAVVLAGEDQVVLLRFDLVEELKKTGEPYLFVQSLPPERATRGFLFTYWVDTVSKAGGVKYRLEAGPKGMDVNPHSGVVLWTPASELSDERVGVIVAVRNESGQEVLHAFDVVLTD